MTPCPECHRHVRDTDSVCPFCGGTAQASSIPTTVLKVAAVLLTPLVLAACYGPPRGGMPPAPPPEGGPAAAPQAVDAGKTP